jgi:hypothetical protein
MVLRRSILWNGLRLVLKSPGALLWTYALNLGLALVFSLRLHAQLAAILDHSLAAERLNSAFDLGTLLEVVHRLSYMAPPAGSTSYVGLPLYMLGYFILVPGALFCYRSGAPSRLSILASSGLSYFWRFVRITIISGIVAAAVLVPLIMEESSRSAQIDEAFVGNAALERQLPGAVAIFLIAALLRLYFDLVEVYTVQLGDQLRDNGQPDRRVRRVLVPALRALWRNLGRAYFGFVTLTLLGFAALLGTSYLGMLMLAQPRVWPTFLLAQVGLLAMITTRFWQRGAETILSLDYPLELEELDDTEPHRMLRIVPEYEPRIEPADTAHFPGDAQPDPEPAPPSLAQPDPAVFHHDVPPPPPPQLPPATQPEPVPEQVVEPEPVAPKQVEPEAPKRQVPWWAE